MYFARSWISLSLVTCALSLGGTADAADYPSRPVRLLVPTAPGGGLDVIARLLAPPLTESLGKPVVVDNRPGASGSIAVETTARAAPDGHTLVIFSVSQVIQAEVNKVPYNLFRDLAPVSQVASAPYVLTVHPSLPMKNVKEFIAYAKANPKTLNYASSGVATLQQLASEWLALETGIQLTHVPYKGVGQAFPDLLSGRTQMTMSSVAAMANLIRQKGVRALAVTSAKRTAMLPDVPTMVEAGVPGFVVTQWHGIAAPAGTPRPIVERLHQELVKALHQPDVTARLTADGTDVVGSAPKQFAAHMKAERDRWVGVIKRAGIKTEG
jgi:tripartite-type tricarboxylate transporter receptor subunit TctC